MDARRIVLLVAFVLAALSPLGAGQGRASVIFNMTGSCDAPDPFCGSTGQTTGDPISGFVEFNDFDAAPNGALLVPDNYHLEFGNIVLTTTITDVFLRAGRDAFRKIDQNHIDPVDFAVWSASQNLAIVFVGDCFVCRGDRWSYGFIPGSQGPFAFTREGVVTEPASAALLTVCLTALGWSRRRRS